MPHERDERLQQEDGPSIQLGGATQQAGNPFSPAPQQGFSPLFDPSRGDAFGLIARLQGRPDQRQVELQRQQEAARGGLQGLSAAIEAANGDVGRGVMNFVLSPEGIDAFVNDPNFKDKVTAIVKQIKGPEPTNTARERSELANLTGTPESELARRELALKDAQLRKLEADIARPENLTQKEAALGRLFKAGQVDETFRDKFLGGLIQVFQLRDSTGRETGVFSVVDLTPGAEKTYQLAPGDASATEFRSLAIDSEGGSAAPPPEAPAPAPVTLEGAPRINDENTLNQATQRVKEAFVGEPGVTPPSADIVEAAGAKAMVTRIGSGVLGQFLPRFINEAAVDAASSLEAIRSQYKVLLASIKLTGVERAQAETFTDSLGVFTSPGDTAQKLISLHEFLDRQEQAARQTLESNPGVKANEEAIARIEAINSVRVLVPARKDLENKLADLKSRKDTDPLSIILDFEGKYLNEPSGPNEPLDPSLQTPETSPVFLPKEPPAKLPAASGLLPSAPALQAAPPGPDIPPGFDLLPDGTLLDNRAFDPVSALERGEEPDVGVLAQIGDALRSGDQAFQAALPPEVLPVLDELTLFAEGFNQGLASALGVSAEVVNQALAEVGANFADPGDPKLAIRQAFDDLGFTLEGGKLDTFEEQMGAELFNGMVALGAIVAAAPLATGVEGGVIGRAAVQAAKDIRKFTVDFPLRALALEVGGAAGLVKGRNIAQRNGLEGVPAFMLEFTGGILGGGIIGGLAGAARAPLRKAILPTEGVDPTARSLVQRGKRLITGELPPRTAQPDMSLIRILAHEADKAERFRIDFSMRRIIGTFASKTMEGSVEAARKLVVASQRLHTLARAEETKLWAAVPENLSMTSQNQELVEFSQQMRAAAKTVITEAIPKTIPVTILNRIDTLVQKTARGTITLKTTFKDYQAIRTLIRDELVQDKIPRALRNNLVDLDKKVLSLIQQADPTNTDIAVARDFSYWLNDRFIRGAFGPAVLGGAKARDVKNVVPIARGIIEAERGPQFLAETAARLSDNETKEAAINFVRSSIREQAAQIEETVMAEARSKGLSRLGEKLQGSQAMAEAVRKAIRGPHMKRFLAEAPEVVVRFQRTANELDIALKEARAIQTAEFRLFSDLEPEVAIDQMLRSANPTKIAENTVSVLRNNPDALEAFQFGLLKRILANPDGTFKHPKAALKELTSASTGPAALSVLGVRKYRSVQNLLEGTLSLDENPGLIKNLAPLAKTGSQIVGAAAGRMLSTGTIQGPGLVAGFVGRMTSGIIARIDPIFLYQMALRDPRMERLLLKKAPGTVNEMAQVVRQFRVVTNGIAAGTRLLPIDEEQ